jgi:hypothetical protein
MAILAVLSPGDLQEIAGIAIVPVEEPVLEDGSKRVVMVQPRECFLDGSQYPEGHLYPRVFTFVDFGERANGFLKACGVKAKPDCSDIVNAIIKDPHDFLAKTNAGGENAGGEGPEKYVNLNRIISLLIVNTGILTNSVQLPLGTKGFPKRTRKLCQKPRYSSATISQDPPIQTNPLLLARTSSNSFKHPRF